MLTLKRCLLTVLLLSLPLAAEEMQFVIRANEKDGQVITEIVTTISKNNVLALGFKRGHLKQLGKQLRHLGPLQFLAYIFSREDLKRQMQVIRSNSFKWNGFVDGLVPGLNRDADTKELYSALPGFAKFLGMDPDVLMQTAKAREWYEFANQLVQKASVAKTEVPMPSMQKAQVASPDLPKQDQVAAPDLPKQAQVAAPEVLKQEEKAASVSSEK